MSGLVDKLRLKEQAEEDTWFARRDRELIEALHARQNAPVHQGEGDRLLLRRVVSGGQTGVDRAALDAARAAGLPIGGWCPRGRRAEDGPLPEAYPLQETPSHRYAQRTEWNVRDSDGTLILQRGGLSAGTLLTAGLARRIGRPLLLVDLGEGRDHAGVREWVRKNRIEVLNVAGPRERGAPGIGLQAQAFLRMVFLAGRGG